MPAVLVTGMSGTGKSTVLAELARRGHRVVDTDQDGWIIETPQPGGGMEPLWDEARMTGLLTDSRAEQRSLFVAGCVANQRRFYRQFRAVALLSVPLDVLLERIARRDTNDFGKTLTNGRRSSPMSRQSSRCSGPAPPSRSTPASHLRPSRTSWNASPPEDTADPVAPLVTSSPCCMGNWTIPQEASYGDCEFPMQHGELTSTGRSLGVQVGFAGAFLPGQGPDCRRGRVVDAAGRLQ
jgi:hypothetical protein